MTIIQAGRLTVAEAADRNRTALALQPDGTALGVLQGVQSGLVLTKTSGMGWQLDLGRAVIAPATAANGPVVATVTVAETGSFAAGDATRDRIDVVALQIDETATIANGFPAVKTVVIQGAYPGAGQPVTPTVPAGSLGLWSVRINAGTSAGGGGWNTGLLVDLRSTLFVNGGISYSPVNTSDANWSYTGGLWKTKTAGGPDKIELALRIKRIAAGFTPANGTTFTQAFTGLIPAGFLPVTFNHYAWAPLISSAEAPVAQILYRIDTAGSVWFNQSGTSAIASNSQLTMNSTWVAA